MRKFLNRLQSQVPLARTNIERQGAMFAHLNSMVEDYQTFTTIVSAEQAATLSSVPVELNVPAGQYLLAGGYIYYSANATENLELGSEQLVMVNSTMVISKNSFSTVSPGQLVYLSSSGNFTTTISSGKLTFSTDSDSPDANGPVEITVYLTTLNLSII